MKILCLVTTAVSILIADVCAENKVENLTLERAIEMAEQWNPRLREAAATISAAEGRMKQAGTYPNPELIGRVESVPVHGKGDPEYLVGLGQRIPISGSPGKAREVERLDRTRLTSELEVTRLGIRKKIQSAFATALYQEQAVQTLNEIQKTSEKAVHIAKARVETGDAIPAELVRVEIEMARNEMELHHAETLREQALLELGGAIGNPSLRIGSLEGKLEEAFELPSLETLAIHLSKHPESSADEAEIAWQRARLELAKAGRIPDLNVEVLYRRIEAENRHGADVGISFPLPLLNRNKGRVRELEADVAAAEARSAARRNDLTVNLQQLEAQFRAALHHADVLHNQILPRAQRVLSSAEARYAEGEVSLNELLPVRREWAELQLRRLEALREVMAAWAELSLYAKR
ncbi:MAG: TolC family protein [Limisphaerales bacterium]